MMITRRSFLKGVLALSLLPALPNVTKEPKEFLTSKNIEIDGGSYVGTVICHYGEGHCFVDLSSHKEFQINGFI